MADIPDREESESKLLLILMVLWASEDVLEWARRMPSPKWVRELLDQFGATGMAENIAQKQANEFLDEIEWEGDRRRIIERARMQGELYSHDLARRLASHHHDWLVRRDTGHYYGEEIPDYDDLYSEATGKREVITSLTGLATGTELAARHDLRNIYGVEVDTYWRLDPRSNWCQTCLNLADSPESVWSMEFPGGPPAHPNCRCFLEHSRVYASSPYASQIKHLGPGDHPSGSPQLVHGGKQTDSAEFKAWFGDSKVVDENGEPLVVFHGTFSERLEHIPELSIRAANRDSLLGPGIYFTSDSDESAKYATTNVSDPSQATNHDLVSKAEMMAQEYGISYREAMDALTDNAAPRVYPVYLKMSDPVNIDHDGVDWSGERSKFELAAAEADVQDRERLFDNFHNRGEVQQRTRPDSPMQGKSIGELQWELMTRNKATQVYGIMARMLRHDGVTVHADFSPISEARHFMVFKPEQIKSATGNDGTFDPDNPNIKKHLRGTEHDHDQKLHGHRINLTDTAEFKRWFADSKVVNGEGDPQETWGEPEEVFHGTNIDFDSFDPERMVPSMVGRGFYFAEDIRVAEQYARGRTKAAGGEGKVIEAWLSLQNPLDLDRNITTGELDSLWGSYERGDQDQHFAQHWEEQIAKWGGLGAGTVGAQVHTSKLNIKNQIEELKDLVADGEPLSWGWVHNELRVYDTRLNSVIQGLGYDGMRHRAADLGGSPATTSTMESPYGLVWIAFDPTQIKSTGNEGTFDLANQNIYKSISTRS